jgi:hypothetical protein
MTRLSQNVPLHKEKDGEMAEFSENWLGTSQLQIYFQGRLVGPKLGSTLDFSYTMASAFQIPSRPLMSF